ncbi:MAG: ParA family protein [Akkermansiaceae bacterium]
MIVFDTPAAVGSLICLFVITLVISSQKGGVGKTTLGINLAHAFARAGRRTLLVDSDPQGSVGLSLTRQSRHLRGFFDHLSNPALAADKVVIATRLPTLSMVAAGQAGGYEFGLGPTGPTAPRTKEFLDEVAELGFDICIFDTAAGFFGVTAGILSVADAVLVPQQSEPLGVRSVPRMLEALGRLRVVNPQLQVLGVVLTMVQSELRESVEAAAALRRLLPPELVMNTEIGRDDLFIKASAKGVPAGVMRDGQNVLGTFGQLSREIEIKMLGEGA